MLRKKSDGFQIKPEREGVRIAYRYLNYEGIWYS